MNEVLRLKKPQKPIEAAAILNVGNSKSDKSPSGRGHSSRALPVYVVEEHHEALPYWHNSFVAAAKRRGKKQQPISLVHIDGHSDNAPIIPDKRFPFAEKTVSAKSVKYLMTSNDNFVMGSKFAGLVSNGLWIFPKWLNDNSTAVDIKRAGVTKINNTLMACDCPHYKQDRRAILAGKFNSSDTCYVENWKKLQSRLWFQRKYCKFIKGPYLQISVPENEVNSQVFLAVLARKILLPVVRPNVSTIGSLYQPVEKPEDHNDYVLDIDEDFFGVQLVGDQLVSADIPLAIVKIITKSLEQLFCPSHTDHEIEADRWFVAMLESIMAHSITCKDPVSDSECYDGNLIRAVAEDKTHHMLLEKVACPHHPAFILRRLIESIIHPLVKLSSEKLRVLQSVGLCLRVSLSTNLNPLDYLAKSGDIGDKTKRRRPVVKLCLGHNLPNDSVVQNFLDTRQGLDARMAAMTNILKRLPKPPVAVTICRSSRDGYVPRQQMNYIESGVLSALKSVFGKTEIKYDPNLYFGREGWYKYKAKQLGNNFRWPGKELEIL